MKSNKEITSSASFEEAMQIALFKEFFCNTAKSYLNEFSRMQKYHDEKLNQAIKENDEDDIQYHQANYNVYVELINQMNSILQNL